ncbi:MAG: hypothetical protein FWG89_01555 [Treponema sp.]|nr:hypothetical protein [Treponema sp.]
MKKQSAFLVIIFIQSLFISGCFDIYHNITKDNNGFERNSIKVTLSKILLEMAYSFDNSGSIDYDDIFDDIFGDSEIDFDDYNEFGASISNINNEFDIGLLISMSLNYRDRDVSNAINRGSHSFIHKYDGKNITIHIDMAGSSGVTEDNAMAAMFLAASKYRLSISKKCVADIIKVTLKNDEDETEIGFTDLPDGYLIEIPMSILFLSAIDIVIYSA